MNPFELVLVAIGGNATLLAILGYLAKSLLDKVIVRDTKRFESDLKAKSDAAIENLKNSLQLKTIEHQVRFSKLHEKRAEVIAKLYVILVESLWETESFVSPMEFVGELSKNEKHVLARNKLADVYRYFDQHRIYLPDTLCDSLEKLIQEIRTIVIEFGVWVPYDHEHLPTHAREQRQAVWEKSWKAIREEIPIARKQLETEFRGLLEASK